MNQTRRLALQIGFWLLIWCILWISGNHDYHFIRDNSPAFAIQVVLLILLLYYLVPRLFLEKKYVLFILTTIPLLVLGAYLSSELSPGPLRLPPDALPMDRPGPHDFNKPSGGGPSQFFIHLLMLTISSITAVLVETFTFVLQKEKGIAFAKAELKEAELKFLKMQINPHFLFNALNNIYALSVTNSEKTQEGISTLSEMLRYVLYDCEQPEVPLDKEINYIENYISLFKLKSSKHFNITFNISTDHDFVKVAPMLFVPFIENAFKHSGIEKGGDRFVAITLEAKENSINFSIENSLPTKDIVKDQQGGIGLVNVQKRLDLLYPDAYQLNVEKTDTFSAQLNINLS